MTTGVSLPRGVLVIALLAAPAWSGCASHDGPTAPVVTQSITPLALERAWPHADGQSWAYRYVVRDGPPPLDNRFATASEVPAVTLEQVAALLAAPPPFPATQENTYGYVLTFQDSAITTGGVRGQNLVPMITGYPIPAPTGRGPGPAAAGGVGEPPVFLRGGVWRQEATRIAQYEDASLDPTWVFLAGALADRTPWEAHPLPGLAPGVVMRARAYQSVSANVAGFSTDDALDVHYLLDYGVEILTDPGGSVIGYRRSFAYGRIIWAGDVGPLYLYERRGLTSGNPPSQAVTEATLLLEGTTMPAALPGWTRTPDTRTAPRR